MPPYDKILIWRYFDMQKSKKKIIISIICVILFAAWYIVFIYWHSNAYVKIKIHSSKEYQESMNPDFRRAYILGTETTHKFYYTAQKELYLNEENADFGECEARIPLTDKKGKTKGTIQLCYFKANNWFQSDIDLSLDIKTKNEKQYLIIKTTLKEEGHGNKNEYGSDTIKKQFLLKENGNYHIQIGG